MATYAVHDGTTVLNVILAESTDIAEEVTGLTAVEVGEDGAPGIGWTLEGGEWVAPVQPEPEPVPAEDDVPVEEPEPEPEA